MVLEVAQLEHPPSELRMLPHFLLKKIEAICWEPFFSPLIFILYHLDASATIFSFTLVSYNEDSCLSCQGLNPSKLMSDTFRSFLLQPIAELLKKQS